MPATNRFTVVLVSALFLSAPALGSYLQGGLDTGEVGFRCAGALALSMVVVGLLGALVRDGAHPTGTAEPSDGRGVGATARRRDDVATASAGEERVEPIDQPSGGASADDGVEAGAAGG